jgi:TrmH family RNA methyltransferase
VDVELTSPRAPRVSAARRLHKRAFRAADRRFLAEGPQAVREALDVPDGVAELFVGPDAVLRHGELVDAAHRAGVAVTRVGAEVMASLSQTVTPQGIVAVCRFLDRSLASVVAAQPRLVAVLAAVRDPGNAGTVVRAADAAGVDAVVLTDASVDVYNPKSVRATAGSLFHVPLVLGVPLGVAAPELRRAGLAIVAADGQGDRDLDDLIDEGDLERPTAWVFGNEAWGLPAEERALADAVVRVPIHGRAESLNLAAAAAVCLYASARAQRRALRAH